MTKFRTLISAVLPAIFLFFSSVLSTAAELPKTKISNRECYYYVVEPGETLYSISRKLGITTDDIKKYNPAVNDGLRAYSTLYFPVEDGKLEIDDTVQSQSQAVAQTATAALPPAPASEPQKESKEEAAAPTPIAEVAENEDVTEPYFANVTILSSPEENDELSIAILLPFMLNDSISRTAEHYTDFYRGFLMAAKEMNRTGKPIKIYAYDTESSLNKVRSILARPEMQDVNLIIAPENEDQLKYIIEKVDGNKTYVLNNFIIKDTNYITRSNVVQGSIPHNAMYQTAITALIDRLEGRTPVLLSNSVTEGEKAEFVEKFKKELIAQNLPYVEVAYENVLSDEDLDILDPDGLYAALLSSGKQKELFNVLPPIKVFNSRQDAEGNIILAGYPEWIAFRNEARGALFDTGAICYSRYCDVPERELMSFGESFVENYGRPMLNGLPSQALLGYDTGRFVIEALRESDGNLHDFTGDYVRGVQSDYCLDDTDSEGLVNNSLLIVRFDQNGKTTSERIK